MPKIYDPNDLDRWYEDAAWHRKASGSIVENGKEVAFTLQCQHCSCHFVYRKSTGFDMCVNCGGFVCKRHRCMTVCINIEKRMELYEAGKIGSM